jgi:hypothetical protein
MLAPISDDDKRRINRFGRKVLARMVLAAAASFGTKVGEIIVDAVFGKPPEEGGDDDDDEDKS